MNIKRRDIESEDVGWTFAEYEINSDEDQLWVEKYLEYCRWLINNTIYVGNLDHNIVKKGKGILFLYPPNYDENGHSLEAEYYHGLFRVNESTEAIQEGYFTWLFMSVPIKTYNNIHKTPINNPADLIKYHKNPGLINYINKCKYIEDLRYIKKDSGSHRVIPMITKIRKRIEMCKKLGYCDETKSYYKSIKKMYLDQGITVKDCDDTIKWCKELDQLINNRISELKNRGVKESVEDYLDDDEWEDIEEYSPVSFLSKRTTQAKNKKAHRNYLRNKQKTHSKKYNFFKVKEDALQEAITSNIMEAEPVFIVNSFTNTPAGRIISTYTHSAYSHTAISLDSSLTHMYSFNADNKKNVFGGFSIESIKDYIAYYKDSIIQVNCIFVEKDDLDKIKMVLDSMNENVSDTRYGYRNIFNIILNRSKEISNTAKTMVCSQFVAYILHRADISIVNKSDNLVTPKDLATLTNPRVYKLYEGKAIEYDEKKINRVFRKLKAKALIIKESLVNY